MKPSLLAALTSAAFTIAATVPVSADQSGLAGMHAQKMVKGRLCFSEHTHVGTGTRQPSKRAAIASAAENWSSFTAFEYGTDWGQWSLASAKSVTCQTGGGYWTCEVQARPCLIGRGASQQARR